MDLALCRLMHWTLEELWALPIEYYEVLIEIAPKWLGAESGGGED